MWNQSLETFVKVVTCVLSLQLKNRITFLIHQFRNPAPLSRLFSLLGLKLRVGPSGSSPVWYFQITGSVVWEPLCLYENGNPKSSAKTAYLGVSMPYDVKVEIKVEDWMAVPV